MSLLLAHSLLHNSEISEVAHILAKVLYPHEELQRSIRIVWWARQLEQFAPNYVAKYKQAVAILTTDSDFFEGSYFAEGNYSKLHTAVANQLGYQMINLTRPKGFSALLTLLSSFMDKPYEELKDLEENPSIEGELSDYDRFVIVLENIWESKWALARGEFIRCYQHYFDERSCEFDSNRYYSDFSNAKQVLGYSHYDLALWAVTLSLTHYPNPKSNVTRVMFDKLVDHFCCQIPEWRIFLHDVFEGENASCVVSMMESWLLAIRLDPFLAHKSREIIFEYIAVQAAKVVHSMVSINSSTLMDLILKPSDMTANETEMNVIRERILSILHSAGHTEYCLELERNDFIARPQVPLLETLKTIDANLDQVLDAAESCGWGTQTAPASASYSHSKVAPASASNSYI